MEWIDFVRCTCWSFLVKVVVKGKKRRITNAGDWGRKYDYQ